MPVYVVDKVILEQVSFRLSGFPRVGVTLPMLHTLILLIYPKRLIIFAVACVVKKNVYLPRLPVSGVTSRLPHVYTRCCLINNSALQFEAQ